ncbi:MAG: transcription termination factor NusA [Candidatus Magasanikbacteria bacterium RIFCSPHIGHO2_02_FULL_47_14]|uniref:Transcription termination/antitermination protein NusA n=1 Tax=Candidatus Magasanikbacteria bacterium RIFCSPHIGHO2_02_FULL_47_14 TaxID=1798680 RepID=A0A1F6M8B1_9BACT|nr:MAG: transcription termination factor NusA [Candidatus Magasanikbacteria bacterium RIFCSPHIGHO2_02_FULL_47_14]
MNATFLFPNLLFLNTGFMSEISRSIQIICDEKGLNYETVMGALEAALAAAYRKDYGNRQQNIKVKFDPETGGMQMWDVKIVVEDIAEDILEQAQEELAKRREKALEEGRELTEEEVNDLARFNPKTEIMLAEAQQIKSDAALGDVMEIELTIPGDFGRMAAQTAKQVIIQKLREAERNSVFEDFKQQEGAIVQGIVQRRDRSGSVIIDLGKITGTVPPEEQIQREMYRPGARMRFYVISVQMGTRGPEIILSRSHPDMVKVVFEQEIPEVSNGDVQIKGIARDAGNRSKVAVWTDDESIDPIGSCIGQRGSRITTIIDELGGEKIDIIQFNVDTAEFIKEALSPAKVSQVQLDEKHKKATAHVAADQFSLAIGRGGQNVRLAAELTGWEINVVEMGNEENVVSSEDGEVTENTESPGEPAVEEPADKPEVEEKTEETV